jgi:thiamine pyrophosphokinase
VFDSICPKIRKYYETEVSKCKVICTPDQCFTDFTKALQEVAKEIHNLKDIEMVYAFAEYGGRLDHLFGLFQTLFEATNIPDLPPVHLVNSNSIAWLLQPGKHTISLQGMCYFYY